MQAYSDKTRQPDPYSLPDVEVFHSDDYDEYVDEDGDALEEGWYYWPCFPGCLPDGDPSGPFSCEAEAKAMAESDALDYCEDEADGPAPQDIVITDIPRGGWSVGEVEGEYVGTFTELDEVEAVIKAKMEADSWWPNVWIVSDHGNVSLYHMDR